MPGLHGSYVSEFFSNSRSPYRGDLNHREMEIGKPHGSFDSFGEAKAAMLELSEKSGREVATCLDPGSRMYRLVLGYKGTVHLPRGLKLRSHTHTSMFPQWSINRGKYDPLWRVSPSAPDLRDKVTHVAQKAESIVRESLTVFIDPNASQSDFWTSYMRYKKLRGVSPSQIMRLYLELSVEQAGWTMPSAWLDLALPPENPAYSEPLTDDVSYITRIYFQESDLSSGTKALYDGLMILLFGPSFKSGEVAVFFPTTSILGIASDGTQKIEAIMNHRDGMGRALDRTTVELAMRSDQGVIVATSTESVTESVRIQTRIPLTGMISAARHTFI